MRQALLRYHLIAALAALGYALAGIFDAVWPGLWLHGFYLLGLLPLAVAVVPMLCARGRWLAPAALLGQWITALLLGFIVDAYAGLSMVAGLWSGLCAGAALLVLGRGGLRAWYGSALALLALALALAALMPHRPSAWPVLHGAHLHLALGALAVLGLGLGEHFQSGGAPRGNGGLWLAVAGALALGIGGMAGPLQPFQLRLAGAAGVALFGLASLRRLKGAAGRARACWRDRPGWLALEAAPAGLIWALLDGLGHGGNLLPAERPALLFFLLFIMPVLLGAAALTARPPLRLQWFAPLGTLCAWLGAFALVGAGEGWQLPAAVAGAALAVLVAALVAMPGRA